MKSIDLESDGSGDDVLNMTLQWGYAPVPALKSKTPKQEINFEYRNSVVAAFTFLVNVVSMLAGMATTVCLIGWLSGSLKF